MKERNSGGSWPSLISHCLSVHSRSGSITCILAPSTNKPSSTCGGKSNSTSAWIWKLSRGSGAPASSAPPTTGAPPDSAVCARERLRPILLTVRGSWLSSAASAASAARAAAATLPALLTSEAQSSCSSSTDSHSGGSSRWLSLHRRIAAAAIAWAAGSSASRSTASSPHSSATTSRNAARPAAGSLATMRSSSVAVSRAFVYEAPAAALPSRSERQSTTNK
mmetsp:Transcript_80530/g.213419  ORF Transcript_80530/g.213419 Transcript_80530/m.213419 type:complete len:222 (+) Transcript_80530:1527-2192(+)